MSIMVADWCQWVFYLNKVSINPRSTLLFFSTKQTRHELSSAVYDVTEAFVKTTLGKTVCGR